MEGACVACGNGKSVGDGDRCDAGIGSLDSTASLANPSHQLGIGIREKKGGQTPIFLVVPHKINWGQTPITPQQ